MTTQPITSTKTVGPAPHPGASKKQTCRNCKHLDTSDVIALLDGVGWCRHAGQYRSLYLARDSCIEN